MRAFSLGLQIQRVGLVAETIHASRSYSSFSQEAYNVGVMNQGRTKVARILQGEAVIITHSVYSLETLIRQYGCGSIIHVGPE